MQMAFEQRYLNMMNQWLILKQEGKSISSYLRKQGYKTAAIYGMAIYGRHVVRELQSSEIEVLYGIDRKKLKPYKNIEILQPEKKLPYVDIIINTVLHDCVNIKAELAKITDSPVSDLEDIIFESYH